MSGSRINFPTSVELQSSAFIESSVQIYFFYNAVKHVNVSHENPEKRGEKKGYERRMNPHSETAPKNSHP